MNLMKIIGLLVFFVVVAGVGFYVTATKVPVEKIDVEKLQAQLPSDFQGKIPQVPESAGEQLSTLAERTKEVGGHVQQVLGEKIEVTETNNSSSSGTPLVGVNEQQKPLHERALDHGLYLYCKGIVEEYEQAAQQ